MWYSMLFTCVHDAVTAVCSKLRVMVMVMHTTDVTILNNRKKQTSDGWPTQVAPDLTVTDKLFPGHLRQHIDAVLNLTQLSTRRIVSGGSDEQATQSLTKQAPGI